MPPQCAVWIPGGTIHSVKGVGALEVYCLFVAPAAALTMPDACCTVSVSPLLRELLIAMYQASCAVSRQGCGIASHDGAAR